MASDAFIDFASFLAPIPGDDPAGVSMPLLIRQKLDLARKDEEPHPDDPTQAPIPKKPEWAMIIKTTSELLQEKSKDLNLAARLTEALARQHGFGGLRDGLRLLGDLVEQCWDNDATLEKPRLHPAPDEGEGMDVRSGAFHWLADTDRGARFPNSVRELPLFNVEGVPQSCQDKKRADEGKSEITSDAFERASAWKPETVDDLRESLEQLNRLDVLLADKLAQDAPDLSGLRQAIEESQGVLNRVLRLQPGAEEYASANGNEMQTESPSLGGDLGNLPVTRAAAYEQLSRIANLLEKLEPHSPIPDLIRRAVELGKMPFRQLVRELIRDPNQLNELIREFGIKEAER